MDCGEVVARTLDTIRQNNFFMTAWMGDLNAGNNYEFFGSLKTKAIDHETASIFESYCYTQIVDLATRLANHSISLIDVIYLDRFDLMDKAVVYSAVADHCGTAISFDILCKRFDKLFICWPTVYHTPFHLALCWPQGVVLVHCSHAGS